MLKVLLFFFSIVPLYSLYKLHIHRPLRTNRRFYSAHRGRESTFNWIVCTVLPKVSLTSSDLDYWACFFLTSLFGTTRLPLLTPWLYFSSVFCHFFFSMWSNFSAPSPRLMGKEHRRCISFAYFFENLQDIHSVAVIYL